MTPAPKEGFSAKLKADIAMWETAWGKRASAGMLIRLYLFEGGFQLVFLLRLVEALGRLPVIGSFLSLCLQYWTNRFFACDFARRLSIGGGLFVPHPTGIVVGADVTIGRNTMLMHHVTIGRVRPESHTSPVIGDGATLSVGTTILGEITIGDGAVIGAHSVVLQNIPANSVAVGAPAAVVASRK